MAHAAGLPHVDRLRAWGCSAGQMVISQLVPFAKSMKIPGDALQTLTLIVGATGNASGRILSGWMSDGIGRLQRAAPDDRDISGRHAAVVPYGGNVGRCMSWSSSSTGATARSCRVNGSATSDFWGTRNAGINYGLLFTAWGVAGIIGPRIGGAFFDRYKNYESAFYAAGILAVNRAGVRAAGEAAVAGPPGSSRWSAIAPYAGEPERIRTRPDSGVAGRTIEACSDSH